VSAVTAALALGAAGAAAASAAYGRWWVAGGGGRDDKGLRAVCVLVSSVGVDGTITFTERTNLLGARYLELTGEIRGLKPGSHGMHIHQVSEPEVPRAHTVQLRGGPTALSAAGPPTTAVVEHWYRV
jgi:Cu/Zn superoxide dismutase